MINFYSFIDMFSEFSINKYDKFIYLLIIIGSLYLTTKLYPINITHISGITLGVIIIYIIKERKEEKIDDFNKETEVKLNMIKNETKNINPLKSYVNNSSRLEPNFRTRINEESINKGYNPKYLYMNVDIINVLYNMLEFKKYNELVYIEIIKKIDEILKIENELNKGVKNCKDNLDIVNNFYYLVINNYQSFIYTLPSNKLINSKFNKIKKRLQLVLRRIVDNCFNYCQNDLINGINYESKVLYNIGPKANDMEQPDYLVNFNIY